MKKHDERIVQAALQLVAVVKSASMPAGTSGLGAVPAEAMDYDLTDGHLVFRSRGRDVVEVDLAGVTFEDDPPRPH